jgi:predicted DNA-binding protein (MmcQ/YjbR family)
MTKPIRRYTDAVPDDVVRHVRDCCLRLPDAYEEKAWAGIRWMVRKRTFAHVLGIRDDNGEQVVIVFRSDGEELEALRHVGPPFVFFGWGRSAMGMVIDESTDWSEVNELVTESYCLMAPAMLGSRVRRPSSGL